MSELKPCPFCGGDAIPPNDFNHHVACSKCHANGGNWAEYDSAVEAWNTRYKRTCKLIMHDGSPACSECLAEQDYDARFCDQCGAEVADA